MCGCWAREYTETPYVTPEGGVFGLVLPLGDDLEREFELVPYGTKDHVEEAWADDVPLDGTFRSRLCGMGRQLCWLNAEPQGRLD